MHTPNMTITEESLRWDLAQCQKQHANLLKALETIRIVSMRHGYLAHETIEATCDSAIKKARAT